MSRPNEEASVEVLRLRVERLRQALAAAEAELKEALLPPQRRAADVAEILRQRVGPSLPNVFGGGRMFLLSALRTPRRGRAGISRSASINGGEGCVQSRSNVVVGARIARGSP